MLSRFVGKMHPITIRTGQILWIAMRAGSARGTFRSMTPYRKTACRAAIVLFLLSTWVVSTQAQIRVLFDASHRENAANADWVIDADSWDLNQEHYPCGQWANEAHAQRHPTPSQYLVEPDDAETIWTGAFSAFGIDLVKLGYELESLPVEGRVSYEDPTNEQDLSLYDILVLPEPNLPFSGEEILAIRDFVQDGGGLFFIADHQSSDRDCDGHDSPHIGNDLMGVVISGGVITDAGLFGIVFNVEEIAGLGDADYWFTDGVDDNVSPDLDDPIIHGPHGDGSGGLGLFGSTAMTLDSGANATVHAHIWKSDAPEQGDQRVTFATAWYGLGRIACIGDSSPADDGTGDTGDSLYDGWDKASGGVANREIHLNAIAFLADAPADETPPAKVQDLLATPLSGSSVRLEWTAPGDDGNSGRSQSYDIRRSSWPILTDAEFEVATALDGEPSPSVAGTPESWTVTGLDPETSYWFALVALDDFSNVSELSNSSAATTGDAGSGGAPGADHLVISEVQTRGVSDHNDEFIELFNPTDHAVDLSTWSVQYKSSSGTTYLKFDLPVAASIAAYGYYLVARPEYTGSVTPDAEQSVFLMGASGGHVFLVDEQQGLGSCTDSSIIDKVAWGSGNCPEGRTAIAHGAGESIERAPGATDPECGNGEDSDDNEADFDVRQPADPQNSSQSEGPCGPGGLGPVGDSLVLGSSGEDSLDWASSVGAATYKLRRSPQADFMQTHPVPDDTWLLEQLPGTHTVDLAQPDPDGAFYYFVNAVGTEGAESAN